MYLRKRNNKWQCLIHYKGTRIAKTFIKKHQAERWAYSTKAQLDNNIFEDTTSLSSIKLKDLLKMYRDSDLGIVPNMEWTKQWCVFYDNN
tara:strand:+ start:138 stop:407 length:270 start_codon:yes stop_codon:yes gene_type:complete